jgi:hypothetical protein
MGETTTCVSCRKIIWPDPLGEEPRYCDYCPDGGSGPYCLPCFMAHMQIEEASRDLALRRLALEMNALRAHERKG